MSGGGPPAPVTGRVTATLPGPSFESSAVAWDHNRNVLRVDPDVRVLGVHRALQGAPKKAPAPPRI